MSELPEDGHPVVSISCRRCGALLDGEDPDPMGWLDRHSDAHIDDDYRAEQDPPA